MNGIQNLQKYLDLSSQRQQTAVANMANVDTPGYRTRDFDFRSELENAADNYGDANYGTGPAAR